jgi:hypothetical protein
MAEDRSSRKRGRNTQSETRENRQSREREYYSLYLELSKAIKRADVDAVKQFLTTHPDFDFDSDYYRSHNLMIIDILIDKLNAQSARSMNGSNKLIQILLLCIDADMEVSDKYIIKMVDHDIFLRAVDSALEVNFKEIKGDFDSSLLHFAINPKSIAFLIEKGIDPNVVGYRSQFSREIIPLTPIHICIETCIVLRLNKKPYNDIVDAMRAFVEGGADLFIEVKGKTILEHLINGLLVRYQLPDVVNAPRPALTNADKQDEQARIAMIRDILTHSNINYHKLFDGKYPGKWEQDMKGAPEIKQKAEHILHRIRLLSNLYVTLFSTSDIFVPPENAPNGNTQHIPLSFYERSLFGLRMRRGNRHQTISFDAIESIRNIILECLPQKTDTVDRNNNNNGDKEFPHFFFHKHGFSDGLTAYAIELHVADKGNNDQEKVSCPIINCNGIFDRNLLTAVLSPEAWKRFNHTPEMRKRLREEQEEVERRELTGLNITVPLHSAVLEANVEHVSFDNTYGYHWTMCPFCLQPIIRSDGCSYIGHEKPTSTTPNNLHPWCRKAYLVRKLWERYIMLAIFAVRTEQPDYKNYSDQQLFEFMHLEVCITCGGPTANHRHFDLTRPGVLINHNSGDYTSCGGGGRIELITRMRAVRNVYKNSKHTKPFEERSAAALEADKAATYIQLALRNKEWAEAAEWKEKVRLHPSAENLNGANQAIRNAIAVSKRDYPLWFRAADARADLERMKRPDTRSASGFNEKMMDELISIQEETVREYALQAKKSTEGFVPPIWVHELSKPDNEIWHPKNNTGFSMNLTEYDLWFLSGNQYIRDATAILNQPKNKRSWGNTVPEERFYADDYAYQLYHKDKALQQLQKEEVVEEPVGNKDVKNDSAHVAIHRHNNSNLPPLAPNQGGKRKTRSKRSHPKRSHPKRSHPKRKTRRVLFRK